MKHRILAVTLIAIAAFGLAFWAAMALYYPGFITGPEKKVLYAIPAIMLVYALYHGCEWLYDLTRPPTRPSA